MKTWQKSILEFFVIMGSILGAFWLEDWGNEKEKDEKISKVLFSIKTELEDNYDYLKVMHKKLADFNQFYTFINTHIYDTSVIKIKVKEFDSLKIINDRFNDLKLIRKLNSSEGLYSAEDFNIDIFPEEVITDSWEATKSSGLLIELNHDLVVRLTNAYRILNRDFGFDIDEHDRIYLAEGFMNLDDLLKSYHILETIYEYQVGSLDSLIPEIVELIDKNIRD